MEERLLAIIKDGKGQIKEPARAEKELGVWRTQIEGLEGELRYYGNQRLFHADDQASERNIAAPPPSPKASACRRLEVETWRKPIKSPQGILEAKGRVTRSELKQHAPANSTPC